jgi:hypothetical protein
MLKKLINQESEKSIEHCWLDLAAIAHAEISSEDSSYPIEGALSTASTGWRAAEPGKQIIRLLFEVPQSIRRIRLSFTEEHAPRLQEFVLRWLEQHGTQYKEIVRQQYVFDPNGSTEEIEDYKVDLRNLVAIELEIVPDLSGKPSVASLQELCLSCVS